MQVHTIMKIPCRPTLDCVSSLDIDYMHGSRGRRGLGVQNMHMENHKDVGFLMNTGMDFPVKSQSYPASNQCWAIIGQPPKIH